MSFWKKDDAKNEEKTTITLSMSKRSMSRLNHLREKIEGGNEVDVIRAAMTLLDHQIELADEGNRFCAVTPGGEIVPIDIFTKTLAIERGGLPKLTVIEGGKKPAR